MERIESIIALIKANTAVANAAPATVDKYAKYPSSITLEMISSMILADSGLKPAFEGLPKADLLDQMFITLFGYTADELNALKATEAGAAGYEYWINQLNNNPDMINVNTLAIALLNGAAPADEAKAKDLVAADLVVYEAYIDNGSGTEGETQYLTVGQDKLDGTAGNDKFVAYVAQNQNGQEANTLGSGDVITGGNGVDTLDAQIISAYNLGGTVKDVTPITKSVENIILHAETNSNSTGAQDVTVNAKYMEGVKTIASNYSDASLTLKNVTTKGVSGGTASQTIAMEYTGNKDTNWDESDMTVYYDQDYLVRSANAENGVDIVLMDLYENKKNGHPVASFDKITINLDGKGSVEVVITDEIQALSGKAAYDAIVTAMNAAFVAKGWNVEASTLAAEDAIFSTNVESYTKGQSAGNYYPIRLVNSGEEKFGQITFVSDASVGHGNRLETYTPIAESKFDTPVKINVDLEKVGLAADGGALVIGSMNKDGNNVFGNNQGVTTTDTVAGFDEFNVTVKGDKSKNSSLSALHSTDNTLRKVTVDSAANSVANLTIGNSNTGATFVPGTDDSADFAKAFKDVQIFDASEFKGDLELNAGFTTEIVNKYLANTTDTTLYGLNSAADELASFSYKGGAGNDTLNLALDLNSIVTNNFKHATDTNGLNVFKMKIEGGAGIDKIIVAADAAAAAGFGVSSATNITIDGGAGNDKIDISTNGASWSYNVAFSGPHFGHDTIEGFNIGAVTLTDEAQTLNLDGFVAHKDEVIVVTVGNVTTQFTVTAASMTDVQIATQVASMLLDPGTPAATATQKFTTAANGGTDTVTLTKTDANVNSVTVEIRSQVEAGGTYDKDTTPIHTATSDTTQQGGLLQGALGTTGPDTAPVGSDTLDFSAYNAKSLFVGSVNATTGAATVTTTGVNADNLAAGAGATTLVAGDKFIWIEASAHNPTEVFNVYLATATASTAGGIDFLSEASGTAANATKGTAIGSFDLDGITGLTGVDVSQLLF